MFGKICLKQNLKKSIYTSPEMFAGISAAVSAAASAQYAGLQWQYHEAFSLRHKRAKENICIIIYAFFNLK